jgi:hypothetical protein
MGKDARTFGQDLMRGEHKVETASLKGGLTWGTTTDSYRAGKKRRANAEPAGGGGGWKDPTIYKRKAAAEQKLGRKMTLEEYRKREHWTPPPADAFSKAGLARSRAIGTAAWVNEKIAAGDIDGGMAAEHTGTSIFDPVLCELVYRWFCPPAGLVLDPFAGGSVRGIVANRLGRRYYGVDLSARQIAANEQQAAALCGEPLPQWQCGDSRAALAQCDQTADLIFSCPPYFDLERYSDDPRDLSAMAWPEFVDAYRAIIALAAARLADDRFACFVVGDIRDGRGLYRNLPGITVAAFEAAGLALYNEAILVTAVGSLPIRVRRQFEVSRKLGKTHQNVLVFCKGDPRAATAAVGPCEFGDIESPEDAAPKGEDESPGTDDQAPEGDRPDEAPPRAAGGMIRRWIDEPAVIERHSERISVVRDDLLEGGSKQRFLPFLIDGADEIVYGGPFCGGAALALSVLGKHSGQRVTLVYAKRKQWHRRQLAAQANGARIIEVAPGYMTNVQAKARAYAAQAGALFLPLGFDLPRAEQPFVEFMRTVGRATGTPDQIWCAAGSGMLARCLGRAFPDSEIHAVAVGLASRHAAQAFSPNVILHACGYAFDKETTATAPFPSCPNYDRKAWEICVRESRGSVLFWNVLG